MVSQEYHKDLCENIDFRVYRKVYLLYILTILFAAEHSVDIVNN